MTHRAAVMKCYDKKLEEYLRPQLGQDATLHFLHCNAHCLLGFSRACDIALKTIEDDTIQESNASLGRDKDPRFHRFKKTETATARVIRMTSDITGPRGDDKKGCRADWLAFCEEQGKQSLLTSYRSNRFNRVFFGCCCCNPPPWWSAIIFEQGLPWPFKPENWKCESWL